MKLFSWARFVMASAALRITLFTAREEPSLCLFNSSTRCDRAPMSTISCWCSGCWERIKRRKWVRHHLQKMNWALGMGWKLVDKWCTRLLKYVLLLYRWKCPTQARKGNAWATTIDMQSNWKIAFTLSIPWAKTLDKMNKLLLS